MQGSRRERAPKLEQTLDELRLELSRIAVQLKEIDRILVGSLDDLIDTGRDLVKAIDRLLGVASK